MGRDPQQEEPSDLVREVHRRAWEIVNKLMDELLERSKQAGADKPIEHMAQAAALRALGASASHGLTEAERVIAEALYTSTLETLLTPVPPEEN